MTLGSLSTPISTSLGSSRCRVSGSRSQKGRRLFSVCMKLHISKARSCPGTRLSPSNRPTRYPGQRSDVRLTAVPQKLGACGSLSPRWQSGGWGPALVPEGPGAPGAGTQSRWDQGPGATLGGEKRPARCPPSLQVLAFSLRFIPPPVPQRQCRE